MIDWFTVVAQIVNFLILVALLKHFLYGPLIRAMDEREQGIRDRLKEADDKRAQAEQKMEEFRDKERQLDQKQKDILERARSEAEEERKRRVREARKSVDELKEKWKAGVRREQDALHDELRRTVGTQTVAVARRALAEMANARLEGQLVHLFLRHLAEADRDEKEAFAEAVRNDTDNVRVRTAFELNDEERQALDEGLGNQLPDGAAWDFEVSDELLCGIELSAGGRKIAWSIDQYLDETDARIEALMQRTTREKEPDDDADDDRT